MPLLKHAKRPHIPSIDEDLHGETTFSGQETGHTDDNPRKKVRWDGCDEILEEEEEESSSGGTTENVRQPMTYHHGLALILRSRFA